MTTDDNGMIHATDGKFAGTINSEAESPLTAAPTVDGLTAQDLDWVKDNVEVMGHQMGVTPGSFDNEADYDAWLAETTRQMAARFQASRSPAPAPARTPRPTETLVPLNVEFSLGTNFYEDEDLPEWPAELGTDKPEVSLGLNDDDGGVFTTVSLGNGESILFTNQNDGGRGIYNDSEMINDADLARTGMSEETLEAAVEYGEALHKRVDMATHGMFYTVLASGVQETIINHVQNS